MQACGHNIILEYIPKREIKTNFCIAGDSQNDQPQNDQQNIEVVAPPPILTDTLQNENITNATTTVFTSLGLLPTDTEKVGDELHEEIVVRWMNYLQKGISKESRNDLMNSYPIPKNCLTLRAPRVNAEILECLDETSKKHDSFISAIQTQVGHALTAIGQFLDKSIKANESNEIKEIADAAQLLTNTHNALSAHRRFKILPQLNSACKKAVESSVPDEFLFGERFTEAYKNAQELKKTSNDLKKKQWPTTTRTFQNPSYSQPGPSTGANSSGYLNYQRAKPKFKQREGRGENSKYQKWNRLGQAKNDLRRRRTWNHPQNRT